MPSDQSREKIELLKKLGARVTLVPPAPIVDPHQFVNHARHLAQTHAERYPGTRGFFADQFETAQNYTAHYTSTGPEIWRQTGGKIDAFVAGAGTGGTISGVAKYLKEKNPKVKIVLADPQGSGLYNKVMYGVMFDAKEKEGTRRRSQVDTIVEGIGINRLTANMSVGLPLIESAVRVSDAEAMAMARWLVEKDGLFLGSSSAVNVMAAFKVARELGPGKRVVTIFCDSGARHLSKFWKDMEVGGEGGMTIDDVLEANTREFSALAERERREKEVEKVNGEYGV